MSVAGTNVVVVSDGLAVPALSHNSTGYVSLLDTRHKRETGKDKNYLT